MYHVAIFPIQLRFSSRGVLFNLQLMYSTTLCRAYIESPRLAFR